MYLLEGSYVTISSPIGSDGQVNSYPNWITESGALGKTYSGTAPSSGTYSFEIKPNFATPVRTVTIVIVSDTITVSSVSIDGPSTGEVGDTITLTASVSPSNAANKAVTWTVDAGQNFGYIVSQDDDSCTVRLTATNSSNNAPLWIRATADDGSGKTALHMISVSEELTPLSSVRITASGSGDYTTVNATFTPSDAGIADVSWSVASGNAILSSQSDSSVRVEPDGNGRSQIKITVEDTSGNTRTATCYVYGYEFVFNTNGGSGGPGTVEAISNSSSYRLDIPSSEPYRSGYEFMGWSTSSSGSGTLYTYGDSYSGSYSSLRNLYAVWGTEITIYFDNDGGSGGPTSETYLVRDGGYSECDIPSSTPTRSGYVFMGWSFVRDDNGYDFEAGDVYDFYSDEDGETVYAIWGVRTNITYNLNGGSGNVTSQQFTVYDTQTMNVTLTSTTPSSEYMEFLGWSTSSAATSAQYQPSGSFALRAGSDTTMYAVWGPIDYYINFNADGGTGGPTQLHGESKTGSCDFNLTGEVPTRENYDFQGWAKSSGGSVVVSASGTINVAYNETPLTLYAVWEERPEYTLTFDANQGQNPPSSITLRADTDGYADFTIPAQEPTREGYEFIGWSLDSGASSAPYQPNGTISLNQDDTLYAVWIVQIIDVDTVTIDEGQYTVLEGETIVINATTSPEHASDRGVYFRIQAGTGSADIDTQSETTTGGTVTIRGVSNGTVTLIAQASDGSGATDQVEITILQRITVTYDANQGQGAPESHYIDTAENTDKITLKSETPTRADYTFLGWALNNPYATEPDYQPGEEIDVTSSCTLYAVWERNAILVSTISLSGDATVIVGGPDITITASVLPGDAENKGVTFAITAGEGLAEIVSQQVTSTGGTMVLRGISGGSVTITATSVDGNATTTKTITVERTITLSFDANQGQGAPGPQSVTTSESSHTFTISSIPPTRDGYQFAGWALGYNGPAVCQPGGTYEISEDTTLVAYWLEIHDFSVVYDVGDGSGTFETQSYSGTETSHDFTIHPDSPTPPQGYRFLGWGTEAQGEPVYQPGATVTVEPPHSLTLYAIYEIITYGHTLIFDPNGGSDGPGTLDLTDTNVETRYEITSDQPVWEGHYFLGWADSADAETPDYVMGDTITVGETRTLYAVWRETAVHITSEQDDVTIETGQPFSYVMTADMDGCGFSISSEPEASWLGIDGGRLYGVPTIDDIGTYVITITASYLDWTPDTQTFTIEVIQAVADEPPEGGAVVYVLGTSDTNEPVQGDGFVDFGTFYTDSLVFEFSGSGADGISWAVDGTTISTTEYQWSISWRFTTEGQHVITQTTYNNFEGRSETVLEIHVNIAGNPQVYFETNGGSEIGPLTAPGYGMTVAEPEKPVRDGYIFDGWYSDEDFTQPFNWFNPLKSDVTVYVKWVEDPNGGTDVPTEPGDSDGESDWTVWLCIIFAVAAVILAIVTVTSKQWLIIIPTVVSAILAVATYVIFGGPL